MSVKIMGMVWDTKLESNKKFVLLAYADHANHEGKSIFPAVETIAQKTGYHERSVQRLTRELENEGYLVDDGQGPKGQNRWKIPLNTGGDKIAPLTDGAKRGDIPSGDIPSGDKIAPEVKNRHEPSITESANKKVDAILEQERIYREKKAKNETYPHRNKFPEPIRELLDVYVKLTGQHPAKAKVLDWLQTGQEWLDLGITAMDLDAAYKKSKDDKGGFTVGRPGSLTNTANMYAGERRSTGKGLDKHARELAFLNGLNNG